MKEVNISKNITDLRKKKGITQEQLAVSLNISPQAVSKWENGESKPALQQLYNLSMIYSIPIEELIKFYICKKQQYVKNNN